MFEGVQLKQYHPRERRACANESGGQTSFVLKDSSPESYRYRCRPNGFDEANTWVGAKGGEKHNKENTCTKHSTCHVEQTVGRVDADAADGRAARRRTQAAGDVPLISNNAALKLQNSESRIPLRKCEDVVSPNANRRQDKEGRSGEKNLGKRVVPT